MFYTNKHTVKYTSDNEKILGSNQMYIVSQNLESKKITLINLQNNNIEHTIAASEIFCFAQIVENQLLLVTRSSLGPDFNTQLMVFSLGLEPIMVAKKCLKFVDMLACKLTTDSIYIAANKLESEERDEYKVEFSFARRYSLDFKSSVDVWHSDEMPDDEILWGGFSGGSEFCYIDNGFIFHYFDNLTKKMIQVSFETDMEFRCQVISLLYKNNVYSMSMLDNHWLLRCIENVNDVKLIHIDQVKMKINILPILVNYKGYGDIAIYKDTQSLIIEIILCGVCNKWDAYQKLVQLSEVNSISFIKCL
jgi:hypothetical protein